MKKLLLGMSAMALAAGLAGTPLAAYAEEVKLTILGVGDVYKFEGGGKRGGFARMNAVAKAEREANPNFLYLFDGDMLSPSLLSGLDKGQNTITLTNIVPFDLAVPGNHEFDFGTENFLEKMNASEYPWAAVNIKGPDGNPIEGLGGTVIKEIAGIRIGIVPVAQDTSPEVASTGDWVFEDTVDSAIAAANAVRPDVDIVIGVVQANHEYDREMIASKAFDVILSGDDHDYATAYDGITAYVETSTEANYLTALDLNITVEEEDGKRDVSWEPVFRFIDTATVEPDPETQAVVDELKAQLDESLNIVIGTSTTPLDSRRNVVRTQESAMGNLIADAMREATGADVAITNGGGIRADKEYPAGTELTRLDILTELPFGNVTVVTEVTGQQIIDALENGVSQVENGAGRFPQVSGLSLTYDPSQPAGSRIVSVMVGDTELDPSASYTVATNDYMLAGGDGYTAFGGGDVQITALEGKLMANTVMDYVADKGTVSPAVEGRIKTAE